MVSLLEGETIILTNPVKAVTRLQTRGRTLDTTSSVSDLFRIANNVRKQLKESEGSYVLPTNQAMDVKLNVGSIVLTNFRVILLRPDGEALTEKFQTGFLKFENGPSRFQYIFYNMPAFFDVAKKIAAQNKEVWKEKLGNLKSKPSLGMKISRELVGGSSGYNPYITILNRIGYEKSKSTKYIFQSVKKETASQYDYKDWDNYYFELHVIDLAGTERSAYQEENEHKISSAISKGVSVKKYRVIIKPAKNDQSNWADFMNVILDYTDNTSTTFSKGKDYRDAYLNIFKSV
jgi:hypothetical protein